MSDSTAKLELNGKASEFKVRKGSVGPDVVDISARAPEVVGDVGQGGHHDEQVAIADDDGSVLQHAADHGPEQVGAEGRRGGL